MGEKKGKLKFLVIIFVIVAAIALGLLIVKIVMDKKSVGINNSNGIVDLGKDEVKLPKENPIKTYAGTDRPIAVMIDNVGQALPQAGLNSAYIVYEIIVEGGLTRLMPVFKGVDLEKIGPVRSSRHYFLDYALENDAIYVHYGWSPQAEQDISKLGVNNINGLVETAFTRVKDKPAPHNAVTSTEKILKVADNRKYRKTSDKKSILNYKSKEVELEKGTQALTINIPYSESQKVKYEYNQETKKYERSSNGKAEKDWVTKEVIATKNIIITLVKNTGLNDGSGKDRQSIDNIGVLDGFYITNGKSIPIKCQKTARTEQTRYLDLEGNEITVNDGNTFIQICPIDAEILIQ